MKAFRVKFYNPEECEDQTMIVRSETKEAAFMAIIIDFDCAGSDIKSVIEVEK